MNKILVIGDSITQGFSGVNYVKILEEEFSNITFINKGLGGDTLYGVSHRLIKEISKNKYELIIIEVGHNDIIIPEMKKRSFFFKLVSNYLVKRGSIPINDINEFYNTYDKLINIVQNKTDCPIILTTLSSLSENLNSETNIKRNLINKVIQDIGHKHHCYVADVAKKFDDKLINQNNDLFLGKFYNAFFKDVINTRTIERANNLSQKRGLKLTIDGIHLNEIGAQIYADTIKEVLKNKIKIMGKD